VKVLFLDIDGVLNSMNTFRGLPKNGRRERIDPACIERLDRIIDATGTRVVVSSTWRFGGLEYLHEVFAAFGLRNVHAVIDITPRVIDGLGSVASNARGREIGAWLSQRPDVKVFAIVDDDADMDPFLRRLVQTSFETGMTDEHASQLIALLGAPEGEAI